MSNAQERALEAYPNDIFCREDIGTGRCSGVSYQTKEKRRYYQKGYEQAEKDVKDALLEWAEDELAFCKKMILNGNPGFEFRLSVYEKLIDKLNSM